MKLKKVIRLLAIVVSLSIVTSSMAFAAETKSSETPKTAAETATESDTQPEKETSSESEPTEESQTNIESEIHTESESRESESQKVTDTGSENVTGSEDMSESQTSKESDSESDKEREKKRKKKETESEEETESAEPDQNELAGQGNSIYSTNEELIGAQQIVIPPAIEESYQFITVKKEYALAKIGRLKVYEEKDKDSRLVGRLSKNGICYILDEDSDWVYIESGEVRGFVKANQLITGKKAKSYVNKKGEENLREAKSIIDPLENTALTFTKTTVYKTKADKVYALANTDGLNVREGKNTEAKILGKLQEGTLCFILNEEEDDEEGWVYIESGSVRGFVKKEYLKTGKKVKKQVKKAGEDTFELAEQLVEPEENSVFYYTLTSTKEAGVSEIIRASMLQFASQFLGNAYVWGGTSLTNGADCSGFVQSIYAEYGYSLPRVAEDQAQYGTKIPVEDALPGDLIFYAKEGYIYHVVMYIGNGITLEAQSSSTGIVNSTVNEANAVWATRIISDEDTDVLDMINNKQGSTLYTEASEENIGEHLGEFKLTSYCSCPICCGVWSGGPTASGNMPIEGRTVAMAGVPFGTKLVINGYIYTVEDRGTPYGHVDVYQNSHEDAVQFGVQYADVYLAKQAN